MISFAGSGLLYNKVIVAAVALVIVPPPSIVLIVSENAFKSNVAPEAIVISA